MIEAYAEDGIEPATELPRRARGLYELGLTADDHRNEPCHAINVATGWSGIPSLSEHCTDPKRHKPTGDSDVDSTRLAEEDDRKAVERETRRVAKAERTEVDDFARRAIVGKVRARDIVDLVLPSLLDNLGQTELADAAKFLGVTEPAEANGHKGSRHAAAQLGGRVDRQPATDPHGRGLRYRSRPASLGTIPRSRRLRRLARQPRLPSQLRYGAPPGHPRLGAPAPGREHR